MQEFIRIYGGYQPNPHCLARCQAMCQLGNIIINLSTMSVGLTRGYFIDLQ